MAIEINDPNLGEKLQSEFQKLNFDRIEILSKINPWIDKIKKSNKSENEKKQKTKELIDIGNFIHFYDKSIQIKDALVESPDFIVEKENTLIGIEIKDLIIQKKEKEIEGILKNIFSDLKKELTVQNEKYKGIYRVEFHNEQISLKRKEKEIIKNEILFFVNNGHLSPENELIKSIEKSPSKEIHFYNGEATSVGMLSKEIVLNCILPKEQKVEMYKINGSFKELWLLLIIEGVHKSSDYSFIENSIKNDFFKSNFNKIFIYDFFKMEVLELKITPHNNQ